MRPMLPDWLRKSVIEDRRGVTAAEYAVLAVCVVVVVAGGVVVLGDPVNGAFARVGTSITNAISSLATWGSR